MRHQDLRTRDQKICDMVADEKTFEQIADRLLLSERAVRSRWHVICQMMGCRAHDD